MKKLYNFRLETNLIKKVDKLEGSRTFNVTNALQSYLQCSDNDLQNVYNVELVDMLKAQIDDLKDDKRYLQDRLDSFMIVKTPLLQRVIGRLKSNK